MTALEVGAPHAPKLRHGFRPSGMEEDLPFTHGGTETLKTPPSSTSTADTDLLYCQLESTHGLLSNKALLHLPGLRSEILQMGLRVAFAESLTLHLHLKMHSLCPNPRQPQPA